MEKKKDFYMSSNKTYETGGSEKMALNIFMIKVNDNLTTKLRQEFWSCFVKEPGTLERLTENNSSISLHTNLLQRGLIKEGNVLAVIDKLKQVENLKDICLMFQEYQKQFSK